MKKGSVVFVAVLALLLSLPALATAEKVRFEPLRAPGKGPDDAKVTVYEIADFM